MCCRELYSNTCLTWNKNTSKETTIISDLFVFIPNLRNVSLRKGTVSWLLNTKRLTCTSDQLYANLPKVWLTAFLISHWGVVLIPAKYIETSNYVRFSQLRLPFTLERIKSLNRDFRRIKIYIKWTSSQKMFFNTSNSLRDMANERFYQK